ncbi:MAG: hypothetical protein FJ306_09800, partial [Planctomycetes bacterium]|nr:hypothetical protein [Planctomycetota bacterium]
MAPSRNGRRPRRAGRRAPRSRPRPNCCSRACTSSAVTLRRRWPRPRPIAGVRPAPSRRGTNSRWRRAPRGTPPRPCVGSSSATASIRSTANCTCSSARRTRPWGDGPRRRASSRSRQRCWSSSIAASRSAARSDPRRTAIAPNAPACGCGRPDCAMAWGMASARSLCWSAWGARGRTPRRHSQRATCCWSGVASEFGLALALPSAADGRHRPMLPVLQDSWSRLQPALRERAGAAAYDAWLAALRPVLLERGTVYLEADNRLAADRVRSLFAPLLQDLLSQDIGTRLAVEVQVREAKAFDALEVSPQQPVVDDSNRTAWLVLKNLGGGRPLPANLFCFHGPSGVGKTFLLRWWREQAEGPRRPGAGGGSRVMWFDLPGLLLAFQSAHHEGRVDGLRG